MKKHLLTLICLLCLGLPALADKTDALSPANLGASAAVNYGVASFSATECKIGSTKLTPKTNFITSGAEYASNELRIDKNSNKYTFQFKKNSSVFYVTKSAGKIKSIKITKSTITTQNVSVTVYGSNTAYTGSGTSYGTSIQSVTSSVTITPEADYEYFTIVCGGSTSYISEIEVVWVEKVVFDPSKTAVALGWAETPKDVYFTGESAEFTLTVDPTEAASVVDVTSSNEDAVKLTKLDGGKYKADFLAAADNVTIKASIADDNETYGATPASLNLTVAKNYTSVTDFYTIGEKNTGYINFPLTVTYQNGIYTYAVDDNGTATLIYKSGIPTYNIGDVIPAGWKGTYSSYNDLPEIVPVSGMQNATENKGYTVPEVESLSAETDLNKVVILKNVTFSNDTPASKTEFTGKVGDTEYTFYNQFEIAATAADKYDVKVAVSYSSNALSLFPIEYIAKPLPDVPVFKVADSDWYNEATRIVYKGAQVILTAPEGMTDWIMSYTVNDGEEELTEEDVTLTISDDTTISATFDDENYITWKFTVVQLPELTFSPEFGAVLENANIEVSSSVEGAKLYGFIGEDVISDASLPYTFTVTDNVEVTLWTEHERYKTSEETQGKYTIKLPPLQGTWEPVTSIEQVKDGDIVTFMAKEYSGIASKNPVTYPEVIMSGLGKNVISVAEFKYEDGKLPTEVMEFTLNKGSEEGKYTFLNENGYLYATTKNQVNWQTDAKELSLSINESDGSAVVGGVTISSTNYTLRYNPNIEYPVNLSTARFAFYATSAQEPVYMYRQTSSGLDMPVHESKVKDDASENYLLTFTCQKGAHLWTLEEDLPDLDNDNSGTDMGAGAPKRAQQVADGEKTWTNHETHNVTYSLPANKMLTVKAVSADGKKHSEALVLGVTNDGDVITGINDIVVDGGAGSVRYYNLQGVEVKNPANGIFIRVANGKTSKVVL